MRIQFNRVVQYVCHMSLKSKHVLMRKLVGYKNTYVYFYVSDRLIFKSQITLILQLSEKFYRCAGKSLL